MKKLNKTKESKPVRKNDSKEQEPNKPENNSEGTLQKKTEAQTISNDTPTMQVENIPAMRDVSKETKYILVDKISVPKGRRKVDPKNVEQLRESMSEVGLLSPIIVQELLKGEYELVAGAHRLKAWKDLGNKNITCSVLSKESEQKKALIEIEENLVRKELPVLGRCIALKQKKEMSGYKNSKELEETTKKSRSSINEEIRIATELDKDVVKIIENLPIANKKGQLKKLSSCEPQEQKIIAEQLRNEEINSIQEYFQSLRDRTLDTTDKTQKTIQENKEAQKENSVQKSKKETQTSVTEKQTEEILQKKIQQLEEKLKKQENYICPWELYNEEGKWKAKKKIGRNKDYTIVEVGSLKEQAEEKICQWEEKISIEYKLHKA